MMIKFCITCLLLCTLLPAKAQKITRFSADSLIQVIQEKKENKASAFAMLQLSQFHILKPHPSKIDFDSTSNLIEEAKRINTNLHSREVEGYICLQESNLNKKKGAMLSGKQLGLKAVDILTTEQNKGLLGKALLAVSDFYNYQDDAELRSRIALVEKALHCFEQTANNERQAYCLEVLTDLTDTSSVDFSRVLKLGQLSLEKYRTVPNANQAGVLIIIAELYHEHKDLATALRYCLMALRNIAEIRDSTTLECQINSETGLIYNELHEYDQAALYMKKAFSVAEKFNDTPSVRLVGFNLADLNIKLHHGPEALAIIDHVVANYGKLEAGGTRLRYLSLYLSAFTELKQYEKAQSYCDTMLAVADATDKANFLELFVYSQAEEFYINSRQFEKGRLLFPKFKTAIINSHFPIGQIKAYDLAFRLDTAEHLYQLAAAELIQRDLIKDSLYSSTKNKQIEQLRAEYDTYQKEKDIELLQKEGLLQRQEIYQSKVARNFSIAGLFLLSGLLALAISRYRLKQRHNFELQTKQKVITLKNKQLEKLLHENEWLLKEVHHRVKNNLQVVMSLLNSQSSYLKDEEAVNAVMQSRNRVQAMSLIHQKLYKTENVSTINMPDYIHELIDYLKDYARPELHILFNLAIAAVELDVMEAVPVGLILNEAITNSCKYAFPQGHINTITVKLSLSGANELTLYIADNGVGLPGNYDKEHTNSFGMLLIEGMVEDLSGQLKVENTNGVAYTISFPFVLPSARAFKIV
jgi:two-component system, sensor histidine kinase PdtaS